MSVWRIGSKVPINVYAGNRPVCQCHTQEDALTIVSAVNGFDQIKLLNALQVALRFLEMGGQMQAYVAVRKMMGDVSPRANLE